MSKQCGAKIGERQCQLVQGHTWSHIYSDEVTYTQAEHEAAIARAVEDKERRVRKELNERHRTELARAVERMACGHLKADWIGHVHNTDCADIEAPCTDDCYCRSCRAIAEAQFLAYEAAANVVNEQAVEWHSSMKSNRVAFVEDAMAAIRALQPADSAAVRRGIEEAAIKRYLEERK